MKERIENVLATVFGMIFLGLAVVVTVETASRKLFNISLQGADELGGYALAVGSTIAFSLALMGRNHIRVDVFHEKFSRARAGLAELVLHRLAGRAGHLHRVRRVQGAGRHAAIPQHGADALGDAADLAAGRLVRGAGDLRAGGHGLRAAREQAAVHAASSTRSTTTSIPRAPRKN